MVLVAAGGVYERIASRAVARKNPPVGRLVESAGRRDHVFIVGQGAPTVVFASGLGEGYESWSKVQPEIAKMVQTISYDRAGLGWSDPGPLPRDIDRMVSELHDLLRVSDIPPPYLFVGHSLGGGLIRVFAGRYPEEVVGLVMVDSAHPDLLKRVELDPWDKKALRVAKALRWFAPFGVARLAGKCLMDSRPIIQCGAFWNTFVNERDALPESLHEMGQVASLGDKPLVVLSRDPDPKVGWGSAALRSNWEKMQEELPRLSTQGRQVIVTGATHYIQLDRPQAVIDAVSEILRGFR